MTGERTPRPLAALAASALLVLTACRATAPQGPAASGAGDAQEKALLERARAVLTPLQLPVGGAPQPQALAALGRALYWEPRLSVDGKVSCGSCHPREKHAMDGLSKAVGVFGKSNPRNSPTILHAALNTSQHWRGDRKSLEDQAARSLAGAASFGNTSSEEGLARILALPEYPPRFQEAFPGETPPWTVDHLARAIASYERTLPTRAPLDDYLEGNVDALSAAQRRGLQEFLDTGCASCHRGVNVGGDSLQRFGVTAPYWEATGSTEQDRGRADVTKEPMDEFVFKVPSLRNVARTAPYFHDGAVASLASAVKVMAQVQLGKQLADAQVGHITAFLEALTSPVPEHYAPPPSGSGAARAP